MTHSCKAAYKAALSQNHRNAKLIIIEQAALSKDAVHIVNQAAVVGLSCRHDVMELLEKRVRSRFSHRKQLIPEMEEKDLDSAADSSRGVLAAMLTVPDSTGNGISHGPVQQWNAAIAQIFNADVVMQQLKLMMNQGERWKARGFA